MAKNIPDDQLLKQGQEYISFHNEPYVVIRHHKGKWFLVRFTETGTLQYINGYKKDSIFDKSKPYLDGVGYFYDNGEPICVADGENKKIYAQWSGIIHRCYKDGVGFKTWRGVKVCEDWKNFANFYKWVKSHTRCAGLGFAVDKDLFSYPEHKCYSPDTCCLIPRSMNSAVKNINRKTVESDKPTPGLHDRCKNIALQLTEYDEQLDERVKEALWHVCEVNGYSKIEALIEHNKELKKENRELWLKSHDAENKLFKYEGSDKPKKYLKEKKVLGYIDFNGTIYRIQSALDVLDVFTLIKEKIEVPQRKPYKRTSNNNI